MGLFAKLKVVGGQISNETLNVVEWIGTLAALITIGWWLIAPPVQFVPYTLFALLAVLPGLLGLLNHFVSVLPRYRARRDTVGDYQQFCAGFDEWWRTTGWPRKLEVSGFKNQAAAQVDFVPVTHRVVSEEDLLSYRPMLAATLWSSLLLTVVFMIPVCVASEQAFIGGFPRLLPQTELSTATGSIDLSGGTGKVNATNGLLFAALGAFVSVMWRMINRINANALTSRFMFTSALRSAIAIMVGLTAGQLDIFDFLKGDGAKQSLFFLVGLFTDWALSSLRARARNVFQQPPAACDRLPLCYVDGLDDGVIDILDEIGIWDVQHLATCEPGELTIRTLYPFNRVIDWIDQAILISYVRNHIASARTLGISGAIDLALTYSYTIAPDESPLAAKASSVLDLLSQKSEIPRMTLDVICSNLWLDYTVEQLYRFWQHHYRPNGAA